MSVNSKTDTLMSTRKALRRLHMAVLALAKTGENKVTLFEDSPLKNRECFEAWNELNAAQVDAAKALFISE